MTAAPQLDPAATHNRGSHRRQVILESTFVVLLIAAAFVLRLWALSKVHFWDETVYLQNAEVICCGKANYSELDSRPPLLSLIFAAVFLLWHHVYAASIATALLNALGPVLLYVSGRMIAGLIPAAIASLLLAFSPFFVGIFPTGFVSDDTGNSLLSDSPALTLILLSFWLLLRALGKQTDLRFACAGFVLALAVLMRFALLRCRVSACFRFWSSPQIGGGGLPWPAAPDLPPALGLLVLVTSPLRRIFQNLPQRVGVLRRSRRIAPLLFEEFWQHFFLDHARWSGAVDRPMGLGELEAERRRSSGQPGRAHSRKTLTQARSLPVALDGGPASLLQCVAP